MVHHVVVRLISEYYFGILEYTKNHTIIKVSVPNGNHVYLYISWDYWKFLSRLQKSRCFWRSVGLASSLLVNMQMTVLVAERSECIRYAYEPLTWRNSTSCYWLISSATHFKLSENSIYTTISRDVDADGDLVCFMCFQCTIKAKKPLLVREDLGRTWTETPRKKHPLSARYRHIAYYVIRWNWSGSLYIEENLPKAYQ